MRVSRALLLLLTFLPACCGMCGMCSESTRSGNVRTGAVRADIDARSDGASTEVTARLRVGGPLSNVFLDLGDGDRLDASDGVARVGLSLRKGILEPPAYVGTLAGDASGRRLDVELARPRDVGARANVSMPVSFAITAPRARERFTPARNAVTLRWTPTSTSPMSWSVSGACVEERSGHVEADSGALTLVLEEAHAVPEAGRPQPCDVVIHLERQSTGSLDPAFGEGGSITAAQWRAVAVQFVP